MGTPRQCVGTQPTDRVACLSGAMLGTCGLGCPLSLTYLLPPQQARGKVLLRERPDLACALAMISPVTRSIPDLILPDSIHTRPTLFPSNGAPCVACLSKLGLPVDSIVGLGVPGDGYLTNREVAHTIDRFGIAHLRNLERVCVKAEPRLRATPCAPG